MVRWAEGRHCGAGMVGEGCHLNHLGLQRHIAEATLEATIGLITASLGKKMRIRSLVVFCEVYFGDSESSLFFREPPQNQAALWFADLFKKRRESTGLVFAELPSESVVVRREVEVVPFEK